MFQEAIDSLRKLVESLNPDITSEEGYIVYRVKQIVDELDISDIVDFDSLEEVAKDVVNGKGLELDLNTVEDEDISIGMEDLPDKVVITISATQLKLLLSLLRYLDSSITYEAMVEDGTLMKDPLAEIMVGIDQDNLFDTLNEIQTNLELKAIKNKIPKGKKIKFVAA